MQPPPPSGWQPPPPSLVPPPAPRYRGPGLTIFIGFSALANAAIMLLSIWATTRLQGMHDEIQSDTGDLVMKVRKHLFLLAVVSSANLAFLLGIWGWRRWGVYGFAVLSSFSILMAMRVSTGEAFGELVTMVLVLTIVAVKWRYFE